MTQIVKQSRLDQPQLHADRIRRQKTEGWAKVVYLLSKGRGTGKGYLAGTAKTTRIVANKQADRILYTADQNRLPNFGGLCLAIGDARDVVGTTCRHGSSTAIIAELDVAVGARVRALLRHLMHLQRKTTVTARTTETVNLRQKNLKV